MLDNISLKLGNLIDSGSGPNGSIKSADLEISSERKLNKKNNDGEVYFLARRKFPPAFNRPNNYSYQTAGNRWTNG